jgi:hypothetical protein
MILKNIIIWDTGGVKLAGNCFCFQATDYGNKLRTVVIEDSSMMVCGFWATYIDKTVAKYDL